MPAGAKQAGYRTLTISGKSRHRPSALRNRRPDGNRRRGFVPHPQLSQRRRRHRGLSRIDLGDPQGSRAAKSPISPASAKASRRCCRKSSSAAASSAAMRCSRNIPPAALELLKIQGLGPKSIRLLFEHYRVTTIDGLERALPRAETPRAAAHGREARRESPALHRGLPAARGPVPAELRASASPTN